MQRRNRPTMEICGNLGLPFSMVPCLHQNKVYSKRKLRVWRTYKFNPWIGAWRVPPCTGLQTTGFHAAPNKTDNGNLRKIWAIYLSPWYRVCAKKSLYEKDATGIESLKMKSLNQCKKGTSEYGPANTGSHAAPNKADNWNWRKFLDTFLHGTVFAPKQSIWKGCYGHRLPKNVNLESVPKGFLRLRACKLPGLMQRRIRPRIKICGNSGLPFSIIPCLHQSKVYMKRMLRVSRA